jgi:SAM-dependent methyltransferase
MFKLIKTKQIKSLTMAEIVYADEYLDYQTNRSWLRKTIRKVYLWNVRRHVVGNALDFGCGVGEHLSTFSKDSMGLEINESTVQYCKANGMNVQLYKPAEDNYTLRDVPVGKFQTLVISHVLEHLHHPDFILKRLMDSCKRLGIKRVLIVVPCEKGFAHDKTHVTFLTKDFIKQKGIETYKDFRLVKSGYFPFNSKWIGKLFVYNELYLLYESS